MLLFEDNFVSNIDSYYVGLIFRMVFLMSNMLEYS